MNLKKIKLFCIPGGGASAVIYLKWCGLLDKSIKVCLLELPGRGIRKNDCECEKFEDVIDDIFENWKKQMSMDLNYDYMLIGYSFGAIAAYELYRRIAESGYKKPAHIYISASDSADGSIYTVPFFENPERKPQVSELLKRYFPEHIFEDKTFISGFVEKYIDELYALYDVHKCMMPVSEEKLLCGIEHDELAFEMRKCLEFTNDTLRVLGNDIKLAKEYQLGRRNFIKMECEVTVFAGENDVLTPLEALNGWKRLCADKFSVRLIPGGHQMMIDSYDKCVNYINDDVSQKMNGELK